MNKIASLFASMALALFMTIPAHADAWDNFNSYLRSETGIADFTLDRSEFGNTNLQVIVHAGTEYLVAVFKGYVVVYEPGKPGVATVFGSSGATFNGRIVYANASCVTLGGKLALGNPGSDGVCLPYDPLVGNAGGVHIVSDAIEAVARFCEIHVKTVNHDHSC